VAAPSPAEFGTGLLAAESYAMAVEILASAECVVAGDLATAGLLRDGIRERVARTPGVRPAGRPAAPASAGVAEFALLPTLADAYVNRALVLLGRAASGTAASPLLPAELVRPLGQRWRAAAGAFPPAARLTEQARALMEPGCSPPRAWHR
jgi:hypothetical protein